MDKHSCPVWYSLQRSYTIQIAYGDPVLDIQSNGIDVFACSFMIAMTRATGTSVFITLKRMSISVVLSLPQPHISHHLSLSRRSCKGVSEWVASFT